MSRSTELDTKAKLYLISAMRDYLNDEIVDAYNLPSRDIIATVKNRFNSEYGWLVERYGEHNALTDWLQGLALPIEYSDYDIINLAMSWGSIAKTATPLQKYKITENYWSFMANKLRQLFDGYRVPKTEAVDEDETYRKLLAGVV